MTFDNIKIKEKQRLILSLKNTFLEKPVGECQIEPLPPVSLLRIKTLI